MTAMPHAPLPSVKGMPPVTDGSVDSLFAAYAASGVFGAGRMARALDVLETMVRDDGCTVFLGLAGPLSAGGMRPIVADMVDRGLVDALVTTGANAVHDLLECWDCHHFHGDEAADDDELAEKGYARVFDLFVEESSFARFEDRVQESFDTIPEDDWRTMTPSRLLSLLGSGLEASGSVLGAAARKGVPVFAPSLTDSVLGLQLFLRAQTKPTTLDVVGDMAALSDLVYGAERRGMIALGGGVPKHYMMGAATLVGGHDYALQVTLDRPEGGGLSGAPLREGKSWHKVARGADHVTVIGDTFIVFPLLYAGLLSRLSDEGDER